MPTLFGVIPRVTVVPSSDSSTRIAIGASDARVWARTVSRPTGRLAEKGDGHQHNDRQGRFRAHH